ncbi:MAG: hypothetical protein A2X82_02700 [Geobacteraceae bacterium GWC2_55_20]|nr:MAG: hypothetical protein A2X82_02700 [Geobacteraceae bacterium GWC2_55_20]OGU19889.1 MAG: hypothetical protein A2X85_01545 [Geobacteraceae bacterium GWF2_54_21]HBA72077.1 hypothetical protein [Geobacter sp.]
MFAPTASNRIKTYTSNYRNALVAKGRLSTGARVTVLSFTVIFVLCTFVLLTPFLAHAGFEYQYRGNRYEGVRPKPVAGYDIELISTLVSSNENFNHMPDRLKMKFYLPKPSQVYLTVRELDYKSYYWMDKINPSAPWSPGFSNCFEWSTEDVLKQLRGMNIADLGALARLDRQEPSALERVAPIILYSSQLPTKADEYLFTFKTSADARLNCSIYREGGTLALYSINLSRQRGGRPFVFRWNSSKAARGAYRVVIKGYFLDSNAAIGQAVSFYHEPLVGK